VLLLTKNQNDFLRINETGGKFVLFEEELLDVVPIFSLNLSQRIGFHPIGGNVVGVYIHCMQLDNPTPSTVLVRRVSRNKFLSADGSWVKCAEGALTFPNLLNAINTCLGRRLKNVELILRFKEDMPDRRIPLDAIQ
jgi:hypothetical protein